MLCGAYVPRRVVILPILSVLVLWFCVVLLACVGGLTLLACACAFYGFLL